MFSLLAGGRDPVALAEQSAGRTTCSNTCGSRARPSSTSDRSVSPPSVVVVGAGAVGLSAALNLLELGVTNVVVIDAADVGGGSSSLSVGVIETQYLDPLDIDMRVWSMRFFNVLERDHGLQIVRNGYLRLARTDDQIHAFADSASYQRDLGVVDAQVVDADGLLRVVPDLEVNDLVGGLYGPSDGYIDGHAYCQLLAKLVRELGGRVVVNARLTGVRAARTGTYHLTTTMGEFTCEFIVNAAGAWAHRVGQLLELDTPVLPQRHHVVMIKLPRTLSYMMPEVMDYVPGSGLWGLYFRHETFDLLLGGLQTEEPLEPSVDPDSYDRSIDFAYLGDLSERLHHRLPRLSGATVGRGWTGLYPTSPDGLPQVGPTDRSKIIAACGVGGVGIQLSPIVGRLVAEWIVLGRVRTVEDAVRLTPRRDSLKAYTSSHDAKETHAEGGRP
ncbi:MAG: NAD(P)/FAD-dependent oxidoreductase [Aggregatilineales bacterium]